MNKVIRFVAKSKLERERLIREAHAIYDSMFQPVTVIGEQADDHTGAKALCEATAEIQPKQRQGSKQRQG